MIRCVIFDMDGVIFDSEPIHNLCEKQIFRILGITLSDKEHNQFIGKPDKDMWTSIVETYGLSNNVDEIIQLKTLLYLKYLKSSDNLKPIPGVSVLMEDLIIHNVILALASSSPHEQIAYILNLFNIYPFFHSITSGEDVRYGKPHPEIFLRASESAGVDPRECLVIEDSQHGVAAAKKANMKCIGFLNPNSGQQDLSKADRVIHSFDELSAKIITEF
jgi:HAD superfamily hydrolase (TIGR01509 family)